MTEMKEVAAKINETKSLIYGSCFIKHVFVTPLEISLIDDFVLREKM